MAEITFPARVGPQLEAYVSRLLDEAGAPGFIWAEPVLHILRVPTIVMFSGWVIADDCIEKASLALDAANFPPCTQGEKCALFWKFRSHPIPDYHYHTDLRYPEEGPPMTEGVFLYKKSRLFWSFPDPPIGAPAPDDPNYILTYDTRLPGCYTTTHRRSYLEGKFVWGHWDVELHYLVVLLLEEENPAFRLEDIAEPFREFLRQRSEVPPRTAEGRTDTEHMKKIGMDYGRKYLHQLYLTMKSNGQLPPTEFGRDGLQFPMEQRLREYGIPFDPEILDTRPKEYVRYEYDQ